MRAAGSPASMPTTLARVHRAATHAVAPTSSAASHPGVLIAEVANVVSLTERRPPLLKSCMQSGVVVPTLLCWCWARLLLHTGHLCGNICKRIVSLVLLVLLNDLVEMPATGAPSSSMPAAGSPASMPATLARVHRAATHAVAPASSAASHPGVLIAEVANVVSLTERRPPLLKSCMQSGVVVPTLLCWCWARLLLHTGHLCGNICKRIVSLV